LYTLQQLYDERVLFLRVSGDTALKAFAEKFDGVKLDKLFIEKKEIAEIAAGIGAEQKAAIDLAFANISAFHRSQQHREAPVDTMPGVTCWREARAIERVGLYIPGGSAVLPSTFLMLGIPARINFIRFWNALCTVGHGGYSLSSASQINAFNVKQDSYIRNIAIDQTILLRRRANYDILTARDACRNSQR